VKYLIAAALALALAAAFYVSADMSCRKNGPKIADAILIGGCERY
jgi:hypothetical protein